MSWIEELERMERSQESKIEREMADEPEEKKIESIEDIEEELQKLEISYETIKELEDLGEDVTESRKIADDRRRELEKMKEKFNEQTIGHATINVSTESKNQSQDQVERDMKAIELLKEEQQSDI